MVALVSTVPLEGTLGNPYFAKAGKLRVIMVGLPPITLTETFRDKYYVHILKSELAHRQSRNPRFSLRAFANQLKIDPSALSRILSGKQGLTPRAADRVIRTLDLSAEDARRFQTSILAEVGQRASQCFGERTNSSKSQMPRGAVTDRPPPVQFKIRQPEIDPQDLPEAIELIQIFVDTLEMVYGAKGPTPGCEQALKGPISPTL